MRLKIDRYIVIYSKKEQAKIDKIDEYVTSHYYNLFLNWSIFVSTKNEVKNGLIYFTCDIEDKDKYYNDILRLVKKFNLEIIREELDDWYCVYVKIK